MDKATQRVLEEAEEAALDVAALTLVLHLICIKELLLLVAEVVSV
jgi:hypothetical protein